MSVDEREPKRITPFCLKLEICFMPNEQLSGYYVKASGIAEIYDQRIPIAVFPGVSSINAKWLCDLYFNVNVNADVMVAIVNKANKE